MALIPKFRIFWIVLCTVFISLSASSAEHQGHKCYWCGPLAEQVHRSQRAPKCSGDKSKVTVCDNDLAYCAIVATSPPYVESRYCVKFYQDECYSLYCNTTKTLKITCPCRGELCNGINTLRENEAFKHLKHNIDKTTQNKRLKRTITTNAGFIGLTSRKNKIDNTTDEVKDTQNGTITKDAATENTNIAMMNPELEKSNVNNGIAKMEDTAESTFSVSATTETLINLSPEYATSETAATESGAIGTTQSIADIKENKEALKSTHQTNTTTVVNTKIENNDNTRNVSFKQIDIPSASIMSSGLKTEIIIVSSEIPKEETVTSTEMTTKFLEDLAKTQTTAAASKANFLDINNIPETTPVIKSMNAVANTDPMKLNSTKKIPSADALQHNDTPDMKTERILTTATTNMNLSTHSTMAENSTAIRMDSQIIQYAVVITIILHY